MFTLTLDKVNRNMYNESVKLIETFFCIGIIIILYPRRLKIQKALFKGGDLT